MLPQWIRLAGNKWQLIFIFLFLAGVWKFKTELLGMIMWVVHTRKRQKLSLIMAHIREAGLHGIALVELQERTGLEIRALGLLLDELPPERAFYRLGRWYLNTAQSAGNNINKSL
jgi:hypothetical protein